MESVKRYRSDEKYPGQYSARGDLVAAADFDRVSAENLALQQRLTVQDQREDDLKILLRGLVEYADGLLGDVNNAWAYAGSTGTPQTHKDADYLRAIELLKPAAEAAPMCADPGCWNDDPVPPAGGEPEGMPKRMVEFSGKPENAEYSTRTWNACYDVFLPVVTRLQAEVKGLKQGSQVLIDDLERRDATVERLQAELTKARELLIPAECPHMIVFDDADRETLMFAGEGARTAALKTWEQISGSWNAHLFVRVERNSRDDRYPSANQSAPADKGQVEPVASMTAETSIKELPKVPKNNAFVTVLILQEGDSEYSEALYGIDGKFRFGYDDDALDDVERWMPLPSRYAEQPAPVAVDDCDKSLMDRHEAWKAGEANGIAMVMPEDWQGHLLDEMDTRFELNKHDDCYLPNDDTQVGVEFAIEWIAARLNPIKQ